MNRSLALLASLLVATFVASSAHLTELNEAMEAQAELYSALDLTAELESSETSDLFAVAELDAEADMEVEEEEPMLVEVDAEAETEAEADAEFEAEAEAESEMDAEAEVDAEAEAEVEAEAEAESEAETAIPVPASVFHTASLLEQGAEMTSEVVMDETDTSALGGTTIPAALSKLPMTNLDSYSNFYETNLAVHHTVKYRTTSGARPTNAIVLRLHEAFAVQVPQKLIPSGSVTYRFVDQVGQGFPATVLSASNGRLILANKRAIGRYYLEAVQGTKVIFQAPDLFYFAFNPFHPDDPTYVSAADATKYGKGNGMNVELNEHLMSEFGAVYQGSSKAPATWIPWAFNQFDMTAIDLCMGFLLRFTIAQRADPVRVARLFSAVGQRIIQGNWGNNFSGGQAPWTWTGSVPIFQRFITSSSQAPAKYAQCWVFSATLVSMGRAIGIPSRSMTNLDSAHRQITRGAANDNQCYIHFDEDASGQLQWNKAKDNASFWNFHVWVDMWFRRTDASDSNGWQAVDSTPQEASYDGPNEVPFTSYTMINGPVALDALKRLDFKANYDAAFMSAASNCAKVTRIKRRTSNTYTVSSTDITTVGRYMLTKLADSLCDNEALGQRGYTNVCNQNVARAYSREGTFFAETGSACNSTAACPAPATPAVLLDENGEAMAVARPLPFTATVNALRSDPKDLDGPRFGDNLVFEVKHNGKATGALRWAITAEAVSPRNDASDPSSIIYTAQGTLPKGSADQIAFKWTREVWNSAAVQAAFKWTNSFKIRFLVEQTDGADKGAMFFNDIAFQIVQPHIDIDCGASEYYKGDKLKCSVAVTDPQGILKLSNVKIGLEVAGQTMASRPKQALFPTPQLERDSAGAHTYTFGGLSATLDTASSRWVGAIVTITSDEMPTISATELILVKERASGSKPETVPQTKKPGFMTTIKKTFKSITTFFTGGRKAANDVTKAPKKRFF